MIASVEDSAFGNTDDLAGLFLRAVAGDEQAARALYAAVVPGLQAWLDRRLSSEFAHGLAHDAVAHAFSRAAHFRTDASFLPWLRVIALRLALNRQRDSGRRYRREVAFVEVQRLHAGCEEGSRAAWLDLLPGCLNALETSQRDLIVRHFYEGETGSAIAASLGRTRSAVAVQLHRICKSLRTDLESARQRLTPDSAHQQPDPPALHS